MKFLKTLLLLFILISVGNLSAQKLQGGISIGAGNYEGDLVAPALFSINNTNLNLGAFLRYNATENIGLRANFFTGKISGDETNIDDPAFHKQRGFSFETSLTEISVLGEFDLLGKNRWKNGKFNKTISPYLFAGLGVTLYNPETNYDNNTFETLEDEIAIDKKIGQGTSFTIPMGAGLKFDISQRFQIGAEMGFRPAFHDNLDGVSMSGNPDANDWYVIGGANLTMRLGKSDMDKDGIADEDDECPDVFGVEGTKGCPDTDGDMVADKDDACPEEAGETKLSGCPDSDQDGIADKNDLCPKEPGMRRLNGCPDSDGDGVTDKADACPQVAGIKELDGCPDTDRDGVEDSKDACPEMPGVVALAGCPDDDGDGIKNSEDACPKVAGLKSFNGCADTDGDGVADPDDKCPATAGPKDNEGCPIIKATDANELALAAKNIQFRYNSADISRSSYVDLDKIADILKLYPEYKISIDGYTDSRGNPIVNQNLSEQRARACYNYLTSKGVAKARMKYTGHGSTNPIGDNNSDAGRKMNRRVEFSLYK